MEDGRTPAGKNDDWRSVVGPFLTMGLELAFAVGGLFFAGRWIDGWLQTGPWGMYIGLGLGMAGGLTRFIRRALELGAAEDALEKHEKK